MNNHPACRNCIYWKKDYGVFTATGWTGMDSDDGACHYEPKTIRKRGEDFCHHHTREHNGNNQRSDSDEG
jgi:hypothetical protein